MTARAHPPTRSSARGNVVKPTSFLRGELEAAATDLVNGESQAVGFVLLGAIIERLSGEDYYRYVSTHIFAPAGMTATAFDPLDSVGKTTAVGYTRYLDPWGEHRRVDEEANTSGSVQPHRASPAGGAFSSADDLLRFIVARRQVRIPDVNAHGPARMLGGSAGANAVVFEDLRPGYDLVILANIDPPAASEMLELVQSSHGI